MKNETPQPASHHNQEPDPQLLLPQIIVATFARLVLNTARRFAYPFAPALSRGLGIPITAVTSLIAVNQITALIGVVFGPLTDRWGYRRIMMAGLLLMVLGMWIGGGLATYTAVFTALLLAGLGKTIFDPAIQAYVGKQVPYQRRARAVGTIETSWAGSSLLGIPLLGLLMQWVGWKSAFWVLGGLGILSIIGIYRWIPPDRTTGSEKMTLSAMVKNWRRLAQNRPALGVIGFGFCMAVANDNLFIVFGAWMESSFGLGLASLGFATGIIGAAELAGEGVTILVSDRIGLKRATMIGAVLTTIAYLLVLFAQQTIAIALTSLFVLFLVFEFTMVSTLSLCTDIHRTARATMMAGFYAVGALGRVVGTLIGGLQWTLFGWTTVCIVSAVVNGIGVLLLIWGIRGRTNT